MEGYSKWKRVLLVISGLLLLVFMGISAGGKNNITAVENALGGVLSPVLSVFNRTSDSLYGKVMPVFEVWDTLEENQQLKQENIALRSQIIEMSLKEKEYIELKSLEPTLNYVRSQNITDYVAADVIGKNPGNWYNMFIVNVGTKNGVNVNSTVMSGSGLVGTVYEVGADWAKVVALIDNKCSISFESTSPDNAYEGVVTGSVDATMRGELFDPKAKVEIGQSVITSGLGVHPKGILIGKVKEIVNNKDNLLQTIIIEPAVNFRKIDKVMVIPNQHSVIGE